MARPHTVAHTVPMVPWNKMRQPPATLNNKNKWYGVAYGMTPRHRVLNRTQAAQVVEQGRENVQSVGKGIIINEYQRRGRSPACVVMAVCRKEEMREMAKYGQTVVGASQRAVCSAWCACIVSRRRRRSGMVQQRRMPATSRGGIYLEWQSTREGRWCAGTMSAETAAQARSTVMVSRAKYAAPRVRVVVNGSGNCSTNKLFTGRKRRPSRFTVEASRGRKRGQQRVALKRRSCVGMSIMYCSAVGSKGSHPKNVVVRGR